MSEQRFSYLQAITGAQFDARDRSLAAELRDLEAQLPKPDPAIHPKILDSAIAGLFAEFPFMAPEEQYALARRRSFNVNTDGRIETAIMRGDALSQVYAKNGTRPSVMQ